MEQSKPSRKSIISRVFKRRVTEFLKYNRPYNYDNLVKELTNSADALIEVFLQEEKTRYEDTIEELKDALLDDKGSSPVHCNLCFSTDIETICKGCGRRLYDSVHTGHISYNMQSAV